MPVYGLTTRSAKLLTYMKILLSPLATVCERHDQMCFSSRCVNEVLSESSTGSRDKTHQGNASLCEKARSVRI
jgi:hypothetical protein